MTQRPLVLDVDGTLIRSDLTHELLLEGIKADPGETLRYARLGLRSKSRLKEAIVDRVRDRLNVEDVPLEPKVVALARAAHEAGREVYLCSGSEQSLVRRLGTTLDFVTDSFGTTPDRNLTSGNKAAFLRERFPDGFDYVGNSTQDYKVWEAAHTGIAVRPPRDTPGRVSASGAPVDIIEVRQLRPGPLLRAMRPGAWWRNLAVLVVPAAMFARMDGAAWGAALWGAALFCAAAAGSTLLDDVLDVHADRRAEPRRARPVAAGLLSVPAALVAALLLWVGAVVASAATLPGTFTLALAGFVVAALLHTTWLHAKPVGGPVAVAALWLTRIAGGAALVPGLL